MLPVILVAIQVGVLQMNRLDDGSMVAVGDVNERIVERWGEPDIRTSPRITENRDYPLMEIEGRWGLFYVADVNIGTEDEAASTYATTAICLQCSLLSGKPVPDELWGYYHPRHRNRVIALEIRQGVVSARHDFEYTVLDLGSGTFRVAVHSGIASHGY